MRALSRLSSKVLVRSSLSYSPFLLSRNLCASTASSATGNGGDKQSKSNFNSERSKSENNGKEEVIALTAFKKLEKELEQSKQFVEELRKDVLYRAADAENARRIGREDVEKAKLYGISSFAKDMLELADTLEKAVEAFATIPEEDIKDNKHLSSLLTGVKMSLKVLHSNLSKHGVQKMNVVGGTKFDPNLHDALMRTPPSDIAPPEHISKVFKEGYMLNNRVLRAAQVGVSHEKEVETQHNR